MSKKKRRDSQDAALGRDAQTRQGMSAKSEVTAKMLTGPLVGDRVRCLCGCGMVGELLEVTEWKGLLRACGQTYRVSRLDIEVLREEPTDIAPSRRLPW